MTTFIVREDRPHSGWNVLTSEGWGIGHTFVNRSQAERAAAALNKSVADDEPKAVRSSGGETLRAVVHFVPDPGLDPRCSWEVDFTLVENEDPIDTATDLGREMIQVEILEDARYVVTTCHEGTDWCVREATAEEMADPFGKDELWTLAEAREGAARTASELGSRWYDLTLEGDTA